MREIDDEVTDVTPRGPSGLRPIGSLMPRISASPRSSVSTLDGPATSSATTGTPQAAPVRQSVIGRRPGATGVAARSNSLAELLRGEEPAVTDRGIRSQLAPYHASFCEPVLDEGCEVVGWRFLRDPRELSAEERQGAFVALEVLMPAMEPATADMVKRELVRLRMSCVPHNEAEDEAATRLQILGEECRNWPPDILRGALRGWARREKFFPTLAELRAELQRHSRCRRTLVAALQEAAYAR